MLHASSGRVEPHLRSRRAQESARITVGIYTNDAENVCSERCPARTSTRRLWTALPAGRLPSARRERLTVFANGAQKRPPLTRVVGKDLYSRKEPQPTLGELFLKFFPGPIRYFASWLLPLSGFLAVFNTAVTAWLTTNVWDLPAFLAGIVPQVPLTTWRAILECCFAYSGAVFAFVVLPFLDGSLGRDRKNPHENASRQAWYRLPLYFFVPIHIGLLVGACWQAGRLIHTPLSFLGVVLSLASCGGLAFTAAHELLHSRRKFDSFLCNIILSTLCYMHWSYSHLAHHLKVGTADDPATARYGESFYRFFPRSVLGNLKDGVQMEMQRLQGHNQSVFSLHNRVWMWALMPVILMCAIWTAFGAPGLLMFVGYATFSILLLETVNYIEHYGLERRKLPNGRYEPVGIQHSWNADWMFTSAVIYQLQRHSHHHVHASMPYQGLRSIPDAPLLPASYPVMMLVALWPGLFFSIMNGRARRMSELNKQVRT